MKGIHGIALLLILATLCQVGCPTQPAWAASQAPTEAASEWLETVDAAGEEAVLAQLGAHHYRKPGTAIAPPDYIYTQSIVRAIAQPPPERL